VHKALRRETIPEGVITADKIADFGEERGVLPREGNFDKGVKAKEGFPHKGITEEQRKK